MLNSDQTKQVNNTAVRPTDLQIIEHLKDDIYLLSDHLYYYRTADEDLYGGCKTEKECRDELALYIEWLG